MKSKVKIIMGIDPGTNYTGYGFLRVEGNAISTLVMGYIELVKYKDHYTKLRYIFTRVTALIEEYRPDEVALESPFFGENVQSMLKLGRAQGVAMAAALVRDLPVFEYAPTQIKQSITGRGSASKNQVAQVLKAMLKIEYDIKKLDATDGLAVALCHHFKSTSVYGVKAAIGSSGSATKGSTSDWGSFLKSNPGRISGVDLSKKVK